MNATQLPQFHHLSLFSNREDMIAFAVQDGIPVLRASDSCQKRIDALLRKERETGLSDAEREEFASYEEIDDYLSLLNRMTRNLFLDGARAGAYGLSTQNSGHLTAATS